MILENKIYMMYKSQLDKEYWQKAWRMGKS